MQGLPGVSQLCGLVTRSQVQAARPRGTRRDATGVSVPEEEEVFFLLLGKQLSTALLCLPGAARRPADGRMGCTFRAPHSGRGPKLGGWICCGNS